MRWYPGRDLGGPAPCRFTGKRREVCDNLFWRERVERRGDDRWWPLLRPVCDASERNGFHLRVVQERDTVATVAFRAQDRATRKQLGILQIAFCTHIKELCGMRPNMRKPGCLLDRLSLQCAYEGFLRHRKTLVSSYPLTQ